MAKQTHELLWQLHDETADEWSDLKRSQAIDAWLDEQSLLTVYAADVDAVLNFLEQQLASKGLSLKTH
jgi:hypothetical protein